MRSLIKFLGDCLGLPRPNLAEPQEKPKQCNWSPEADAMACAIEERVLKPQDLKAAQIASDLIQLAIAKFEQTPNDHVIVEPAEEVDYFMVEKIEKILHAKGWYFSSFGENRFYITPNTLASMVAEGREDELDSSSDPSTVSTDALNMARAIIEKVLKPREIEAQQTATWMIKEALRLFELEPDNHLIVEPAQKLHHEVVDKIEKILQPKGWHFSRWQENQFWISPSTASFMLVDGRAEKLDPEIAQKIDPLAEYLARAIIKKVFEPRGIKAQELADWFVEEAKRLFEAEPDTHVIVKAEEEISHHIFDKIEKIMTEKGWYFSHHGENQFWISPRVGKRTCEEAPTGGMQIFY